MLVYRMQQTKKKSEQGVSSVLTTSGKRKVSLVLEPELGDRLERLALLRNQSLNKLCAELIVAGESLIHEEARADAVGMLEGKLEGHREVLERLVKSEMGKMSGRLASLLARTALEATATRALQLRVVGLQVNDKQEVARLRDSAWKAAVGSLKDPTPALRESLDVLVSGVSVSGTEALPRALGVVEALVSNLEGNLGKFERDVGENVGSVQVEVKALRDEVSWLSVDVKTILVALDEALKPKGGIGNFLKRL
jgi:hypothetical protein